MTALYAITLISFLVACYWWAVIYPQKLVIRDEATGEPYLTRYHLINTKRLKIFLHHIWRADKDRDLHNHPWPEAMSIILSGGYCETRVGDSDLRIESVKRECEWWDLHKLCTYVAPAINTIEPGTYHRITKVLPNTWTLWIAGERSRRWGFLTYGGKHMDWCEYLGLPADTDLGD